MKITRTKPIKASQYCTPEGFDAWMQKHHGISQKDVSPAKWETLGTRYWPIYRNECEKKLDAETFSDIKSSVTASDSTAKWWMAKYYTVDGKVKKVYFEGPRDITKAEKMFEDWIPEPYKKAVFLGSAPNISDKSMKEDGFEKVSIQASDEVEDEDLEILDQEFTSRDTSINSSKLPAIYKLVNFPKGSTVVDYGGGKFDNAMEYLASIGCEGRVYDPYNRDNEYNRETVRFCKKHGGADIGLCSNVLNVIKEPEVRKNVLQNIAKLVKSGGDIYITVYEGKGSGEGKQSQADAYQTNMKTADYLEEIQEVFPNAKRKGKLIFATNTGAILSREAIYSNSEAGFETIKEMVEPGYEGSGWFEDEIALKKGDGKKLSEYLSNLGFKVKQNFKSKYWFVPGEFFWDDETFYTYRPDPKEVYAKKKIKASKDFNDAPRGIREACKEIQDKLYDAASELMQTPEFGFELSDIADYLVIEVEPIYDEDYSIKPVGIKAEVRAELSYDGMDELARELNPIVEKQDPNSYFDHLTSGIIDAYMYFPEKRKSLLDDVYETDSFDSISSSESINEESTSLTSSIRVYKTKNPSYCPHCTNMTLAEVEDGLYICDECGAEYHGVPAFNGGLELTPIDEVESSECINCSDSSEYKVRFYQQDGPDKGDLDHEEFFKTKEDAIKAYRNVFKRELYNLNPTVWVKEDDDWRRLMCDELVLSSSCINASDTDSEDWKREYNSELSREEYTLHSDEGSAFIYGFDNDGRWGYHATVDLKNGRHLSKSFHLKDSLEKAKEYCETRLNISKDKVEAASYGGAYDIEDDQYFTKEELVEFGNRVCDEFNMWSNQDEDVWNLESVYLTPEENNLFELSITDGDITLDAKVNVDMRKIRRPKDIEKYFTDIFKQLQQGYKEYFDVDSEFDVHASEDIKASSYSDEDYEEFMSLEEPIFQALQSVGGDLDDFQGDISHSGYLNDRLNLHFETATDKKIAPRKFKKSASDAIKKALQNTRFGANVEVDFDEVSRPSNVDFPKDFQWYRVSVEAWADDLVDSSEKITSSLNTSELSDVSWDDPEDKKVTFDIPFDVKVEVESEDYFKISDDEKFDALEDEELDMEVDDSDGLAEKLQDLLDDSIPLESGTYRASGVAHLVYKVENVYPAYEEYSLYGYYTEDADVTFDFRSSWIESLQVEKID